MKDIRSRMVSITDRVAAKAADKNRLTLVRKPETDEWVVKVFIDGKFDEGKSYYTDDRQDAVQTMKRMKKEMGITAAGGKSGIGGRTGDVGIDNYLDKTDLALKKAEKNPTYSNLVDARNICLVAGRTVGNVANKMFKKGEKTAHYENLVDIALAYTNRGHALKRQLEAMDANPRRAAFVDQPVPWDKDTEADLEKQREEAELKLKHELQEVKGDFWEPGRTMAIHFAMTGIPMFMEYNMRGLRSLAYRDGVLTVNPSWLSTRQEFTSYGWAPLVDKMIQVVKQSPRISDMVEDTLKRVEDKLKIEIPRDVRQDIAKWIERAAERRLSVRAYPGTKGKEFVITPQSADASRTAGVSGNDIYKGLGQFDDVERALTALVDQYDDYWSFGTSPDAVLEDMMAMSTEIASVARPLMKKLKNKIPAWEKEARSRR